MDSPFWVHLFNAVLVFVVFLLTTALLIWGERRIVGQMQDRRGPNRIGPLGVLQTLVDGGKMFFKEDITPGMVERGIYTAAPIIAVVVTFMTVAVIPIGGEVTMFGETFTLVAADLEVGALWILAMGSLHIYAVFLAGWSSRSPYPLLGAVRATAQMVSYEIAQGLAVASVLIYTGSLRVLDIVAIQQPGNGIWPGAPNWLFLPLFPAFAVFMVAMVAEAQRPPFDIAEAEGELGAGFHTEYSGMRFGMFMLSEFMGVVIQSAIVVTLFFGGPNGPLFGPSWLQAILPVVYFLVKTSVFIVFFVLLRGAEPRMRYDKLMNLGWKIMIPIALAWVVIQAAIMLFDEQFTAWPDGRLPAVIGLVVMVGALVVTPFVRRDPTTRDQMAVSSARDLTQRVVGPYDEPGDTAHDPNTHSPEHDEEHEDEVMTDA